MRVAVRILPDPTNESLHGYLARVAGYNGYKNLSWLLGAVAVPRSFVTRPCDLSGLVQMLGGVTDSATLAGMAFWPSVTSLGYLRFGSTVVSPYNLSLQRSKYCPVCCANDRVAPRIWALIGYVACPHHSCLLRDECPRCGDAVPLLHPYRLQCRCSASLSDTPSDPASSAAIALSRFLDGLALGNPPTKGAAPVQDLETALRLIRFFGVAHPGQSWRSGYISKPLVREMAGRVEQAASVLLDWPHGLLAFIDSQRRRPTEGISLTAEFGPFLSRLREALNDPRFEEIIETVRRHISGPTHRVLTKPSSFFHTTAEQTGIVSAKTAGKVLGLTTATIARLIASGALRGESRRMGGRRAHFVESNSVENFIHSRARVLTVAEVARDLGISTFQVERLRQHRLVASVTGIGNSLQEHRYLPEAVTSFVEQLRACASNGLADSVSLSEVARMRSVALVEIIRQILAGLIPAYYDPSITGPMLDSILVCRIDLSKMRIGSSGCPRMSVRSAAKALGMAARMVPLLVNAGCLTASSSGKALARHGVSLRSVEEFPKLYATSRRLAVRHRTSSRVVMSKLTAARVTPVLRSDPRRGISAVWRQADVERVSAMDLFSPANAPKAKSRGGLG
ncbi:TniQ family protein [Microvirga sp. 17 mud 1-3]|uniref:TniQ family protein n=1 Tax=Microvirga sp. 17 mud 1-3 TaxID=2082949 RepID=UPI000D6BE32B|nr:hypothetical protein C4E04_01220 [Microvirga sp. 17 mud 1-3]